MLSGQVALITGGSSGIGEGISKVFAGYGASVCILARGEKAGNQVCEAIRREGREAYFYQTDITDRDSCLNTVNRIISGHGRIDILVNCAGTCVSSSMMDVTDKTWDLMMDLNVKGMLYMIQAAGAEMQKRNYGRIVNISSIAGKIGESMNGPYCVTKAAVNMMTQVFGRELAPFGITVNAVCPGPTETALMQAEFERRSALFGQSAEELKEEYLENIPMHRLALPEEIAEVTAFLVSKKASIVTGCSYTAAGGLVTI